MNALPDPELEARLRALPRPAVPSAWLESSLAAALAANRAAREQSQRPGWRAKLPVVPRVLRWPLAACWLLSLWLRCTLPPPLPIKQRGLTEAAPAPAAEVVLAWLEQRQRFVEAQLDALLHEPSSASSPQPLPGLP